jgi:hypothetical protein
MYKATVRALIRYSVKRLNVGDARLLLKLAAPTVQLAFPGDNSWSTMFRPVTKGRACHYTHRGIDECTAFAQRFTEQRLQFSIEDILVNGPPWNTRIGLRVHSYVVGPGGNDEYNNRLVAFMQIRWARLVSWEDYEDTERVNEWDQRVATS